MKTHKLELTDEQIDKYGLRELVPFTGWAKCENNSSWLIYYEENKLKYGIDVFSEWFEIDDFCVYKPKQERPATPEEIETGLIEMAKKMGFNEGVKFSEAKRKSGREGYCSFCSDYMGYVKYTDGEQVLLSGGRAIFCDGKWAQIIPDTKEMTIEEIQKELGYKIKIVE